MKNINRSLGNKNHMLKKILFTQFFLYVSILAGIDIQELIDSGKINHYLTGGNNLELNNKNIQSLRHKCH